MTIPAYLLSGCKQAICCGCAEAVKANPATGRWYITMGHPGFNSRANNGAGYATKAAAEKALAKYGGR